MNKLFKLTGVSMLAIMATANANAAGYTCEELIEYTSCNPGYYLEKAECPGGYTYYSSLCIYSPDDGGSYLDECSKEKCDGNEFCTYLGTGCAYDLMAEGETDFIQTGEDGMCYLCPVGSICAGGTAGATQCPAGSYCATTGLSQPTGKCNVGTYSYAGATSASCTACPSTGLTDINGAVVNGTTLSTGSTSITACIVGSDAQFKDDAGIYHYKQNCSFDLVELCEELADDTWSDFFGEYDCEYFSCDGGDGSLVFKPSTGDFFCWNFSACGAQGGVESVGSLCVDGGGKWDGATSSCECPVGMSFGCNTDTFEVGCFPNHY